MRALVITASEGYLPGLHAFLNAFEYYENKNINVFILCSKGPSRTYAEFIQNKFSFLITPVFIEDYSDENISIDGNCIWAKYKFIPTLTNYDSVCHLDADCLLLGNLESTFDFIEETKGLAGVKNNRSPYKFEDYKDRTLTVDYCLLQTLYNYPLFFSFNEHIDLMNYMWRCRDAENCSNDPIIFNKSLFDLDKHKSFTPLSGDVWCGEGVFHSSTMRIADKEKKIILNPNGDRMMIWHSRWWSNYTTLQFLNASKNYKNSYTFAKQNVDVGISIISFLSNNCTVTKKEFLTEHPECEYYFTR